MKIIIVILIILISLLGCDNSKTSKVLITKAESCMNEAVNETQNWLKILDNNGYIAFAELKYPPPIDEIMKDTVNTNEIQRRITWMEREFGKVQKRDFFGAHVVNQGKLFTYVPDKMKRFKQISPKRLGLNDISDLYKNEIEGTYVLLMYESKPVNKEKAEELILVWLNRDNKWSVVDYYIDDEI